MVHPSIVTAPRVLTYGDGDLPARPAIGAAFIVTALESTHNVGVVHCSASVIVVVIAECEGQVVVFEEACHFFMQSWEHRPFVPITFLVTRPRLPLRFLVWHDSDDMGIGVV
jgi:hypothetical protein